MNEYLKRYTFL